MIRPSSLKMGRYCSLSPRLSEEHPDFSPEALYGSNVDAVFTAAMMTGEVPTNPDALACVEWVESNLQRQGWKLHIHEKVQVYDPDTGGLLTEGTPDVVGVRGEEVVVVDLKKREQYWVGRLDEIDVDLQTHAYALGKAMEVGAARYTKCHLLFGGGQVEARFAGPFWRADWPAILEEIKTLDLRPVKAVRGPHCLSCYPRQHCPAWMLPANDAQGALTPLTKPGGLTKENAGAALELVSQVKDMVSKAEEQLKDYARKNGGITHGDRRWAPVTMPGRKSAKVEELEAAGLTDYVRQGGPYETFRWVRAKSS